MAKTLPEALNHTALLNTLPESTLHWLFRMSVSGGVFGLPF
jgi:hypothetical protein